MPGAVRALRPTAIWPQQYLDMRSQHDLIAGAHDANGGVGMQEPAGAGVLVRLDTATQ
jgi:hypothetical protein